MNIEETSQPPVKDSVEQNEDELTRDPIVELILGGTDRRSRTTKLQGLIDTGASSTFISQSMVRTLGLTTIRRQPKVWRLGNKGLSVETFGVAEVVIRRAGAIRMFTPIWAHVMENPAYEVILGRDFQAMLGMRLVIDKERVRKGLEGIEKDLEGETDTLAQSVNGVGNVKTEDPMRPVDDMHSIDNKDSADGTRLTSPVPMDGELFVTVYEEPDIIDTELENDLSKVEDKDVRDILGRYTRVASSELNDEPCSVGEHDIELVRGTQPFKRTYYKVGPKEQDFIEKEVAKLLKLGIITHSRSPWGAPVVLVKKKGGDLRMCVDYRKLNEGTIADVHPLPYLEDTLDRLAGKKFFTHLDLKSGYWQIKMNEASQSLTAFMTHKGLYHWNRMPFGLRNATATFQRIMRRVISGLEYCCEVFVDDMLIFSETREQHLKDLESVVRRLEEAKLIINLPKCEFCKHDLHFLGHHFSADGVGPDAGKVDAITKMGRPKDVSQVRSFLGMTNYYRRFIRDYATKAFPLTSMTHKGATFQWDETKDQAFLTLKAALSSAPILRHADFMKPFKVSTDASTIAVGGTLSQEYDGTDLPVCFYSRKLDDCQRRYTTTEQECLGVVEAIKIWRHYLSHAPFTVETDHAALQWLNNVSADSCKRLLRWSLLLQEFTFTIRHRPGATNFGNDVMSRLITIELVDRQDRFEEDLRYFLKNKKHLNETSRSMSKRVENLAQHLVMNSRMEDGKEVVEISKDGRPMPAMTERKSIIERCHLLGHFGIESTAGRVLEEHWWPSVYADVKNQLDNCEVCKAYDNDGGGRGVKHTLKHLVTRGAWDRVSLDFVGPLTKSPRGNVYLLVVIDHLTKWVEAFPTPDNKAETVAKILANEIICRYGPPCQLLSDQGKEFVNKVVTHMSELSGTVRQITSGYHPQTNGLCERTNGVIMSVIKKFSDKDKENWDLWVPWACLCDRSRVRKSTGHTPMYMMFGRETHLFKDYTPSSPNSVDDDEKDTTERLLHIRKLIEIVHPKLTLDLELQARKADATQDKIQGLIPGTFVQVKRMPKTKIGKQGRKYQGVYKVVKRESGGNYTLETLTGRAYPTPMHPDRLRVIGKDLALKLLTNPLYEPDTDDEDDETYEVEKIVEHKQKNGQLYYLIKWTGYNDPSWEPESSCVNMKEELERYWNAIHHIADQTNQNPRTLSLEDVLGTIEDDGTAIERVVANSLKPIPTPKLRMWLSRQCGEVDLELYPAQEKLDFCKTALRPSMNKVAILSQANSLFVNPPWHVATRVLTILEETTTNKEIWMILPEIIDPSQGSRHIRWERRRELPRSYSLFQWANGKERKNSAYKFHLYHGWINGKLRSK